jgi:tRNA(Arg) A34 adenosine deaminase TadA
MSEAIALSCYGMENNFGSPFHAIMVKDNPIIGRGRTQVTSSDDPTTHAEIIAIRDACRNLDTSSLSKAPRFKTIVFLY